MFPFVTDATSAVQFVVLLLCGIMGLSHLLRPDIWVRFFSQLASHGTSGVIVGSLVNSAAVVIILPFHNIWAGPALAITVLGWLLLGKMTLGLVVSPARAVRSLELARRGANGFRAAGAALLIVAACAALALAGF